MANETPRVNQCTRQLQDIPAEEIKQAMLAHSVSPYPLEELIESCEAAFRLTRQMEPEPELKEVFFQLEKQFGFWKALLV